MPANKRITYVFILLLSLFFQQQLSASIFNVNKDTATKVIIWGKITNANMGGTDSCLVELIRDNMTLQTISLGNQERIFNFELDKNSYYAIRITKPGFLPRLISVNTYVPPKIKYTCSYAFKLDLIPEEKAKRLNKEVTDYPITVVHYDVEWDTFLHAEEYTRELKKEMENEGQDGDKKPARAKILVDIDSQKKN